MQIPYTPSDFKTYLETISKEILEIEDCSIWYDEFSVAGENFTDTITEALKESVLFTMVVTPNLINEENYVMETEYPLAVECKNLYYLLN